MTGEEIFMPPHSICILPPGIYHKTVSDSPDVRKLAFQFFYRPIEKRSDDSQMPLYSLFHSCITRITEPRRFISERVCQIASEIRGELISQPLGYSSMQNLLISELYISLMRTLNTQIRSDGGAPAEQDTMRRRYVQIEQVLFENPFMDITAEEFAAQIGLSRRHMNRIFRQLYGMSFHEKLIENRMTSAADLLKNSGLSIEVIGERLGYSTSAGFYTAFRDYYGMSPSEYRKQADITLKNGT